MWCSDYNLMILFLFVYVYSVMYTRLSHTMLLYISVQNQQLLIKRSSLPSWSAPSMAEWTNSDAPSNQVRSALRFTPPQIQTHVSTKVTLLCIAWKCAVVYHASWKHTWNPCQPTGQDPDHFFKLMANSQSRRLDDQRATLTPLPSPKVGTACLFLLYLNVYIHL